MTAFVQQEVRGVTVSIKIFPLIFENSGKTMENTCHLQFNFLKYFQINFEQLEVGHIFVIKK